MPAIKKELERITGQHTEDIADGAGVVAETNPPRVLNIAMAISGGKTLNIAKACDIFYGNDPADSQTITEAISRGVAAGSPYDSIDAILRHLESAPEPVDPYPITLFTETVTTTASGDIAMGQFTDFTDNISGEVKIIINDESYICSPNGERIWCYGATYNSETGDYDFSQYPFRIGKASSKSFVRFYAPTVGTYTVTVKTPQEA